MLFGGALGWKSGTMVEIESELPKGSDEVGSGGNLVRKFWIWGRLGVEATRYLERYGNQ